MLKMNSPARHLPLKPLKKRGSLADAAMESIRTAIFTGKYQPGDRLREISLAGNLGVSQAVVREALMQLEQMGLVVRTRNIGAVVTRLSNDELRERIKLRSLLECVAATEAAPRMKPADFEELERRLSQMNDAAQRNDHFGAAQADLQFHRFIWEKSGNRTLYQLLDQLTAPLFAFLSIIRISGFGELQIASAPHAPLIESLRSADRQQIEKAFRFAIENSYDAFLSEPAIGVARAFGWLSKEAKT
jgi:DNA-binding GntR family transcriptional regulator